MNYGFIEQTSDILPAFILSLACGAAVFPITFLSIPNYAMIALQGGLGLGLYIALARLFKMEAYGYIYGTFKERFMGGRKL